MSEDGETFCIRADSMDEAVKICLNSYLEDMKEEHKEEFSKDYETDHYHKNILQSCSLVGELKN